MHDDDKYSEENYRKAVMNELERQKNLRIYGYFVSAAIALAWIVVYLFQAGYLGQPNPYP